MQAYLKVLKEIDDVHNQKVIQDDKMAKRSQKITGNLEIKKFQKFSRTRYKKTAVFKDFFRAT